METAITGVRQSARLASWSSVFPYDSAAIRLHEMAWIEAGPDFVCLQPASIERVLFVYCLSGSGEVLYKDKQLSMKMGDGLLIDLAPGYLARSCGTDWHFVWIQMSGALALQLLHYIHKDRGACVFECSRDLLPLCDKLYALAKDTGWSYPQDVEISCTLYHLLGILHSAPVSVRRTEAAVLYIQTHYMDDLCTEQLASLCNMSLFHFSRCFKAEMNVSPLVYVHLLRMQKAKEYLLNSDYSITHIANLVGFSDASYFARLFKQKTGYLPKDFRKFSLLHHK